MTGHLNEKDFEHLTFCRYCFETHDKVARRILTLQRHWPFEPEYPRWILEMVKDRYTRQLENKIARLEERLEVEKK